MLLERYLSAGAENQPPRRGNAGALGRRRDASCFLPDLTQEDHFDGQPFGTRAGTSVRYTFPADGEYQFELRLTRDRNELIEGLTEPHQVEVSVDGVAAAGVHVEARSADRRRSIPSRRSTRPSRPPTRTSTSGRRVTGGPHVVQVAFIKRPSALIETERQPYLASYNSDRTPRTQPALYSVSIAGPFNPSGIGETPSRKRIFSCRPAKAAATKRRARGRFSRRMARRAYRRPATNRRSADAARFLQAGARRRQLRARHRDGASRDADEPGISVPHRAGARNDSELTSSGSRHARTPIASAISSWRRGCRSSCGAAFPTTSFSMPRSKGASRIPRCSSSRFAACSPTRAPKRWSTTSPRSGCTCATSTRTSPTSGCFPISTTTCARRSGARRSCCSKASLKENRSVLDLLRADYTFVNRAPREALRHSERLRQPLQARRAREGSRARRAARPGQHHDRHLVREPHVAGAPRQVDSRESARHARSAAAA